MDDLSAVMADILAANIKGLRRSLDETQTEFAERIGVSQATIARWEDGAEPKNAVMLKMAQLAGVAPAVFTTQLITFDRQPAQAPEWDGASLFLQVKLPSEDALTEMFEALLGIFGERADEAELARKLAQHLPTALAQTAGRPISAATATGLAEIPEAPSDTPDRDGRAPQR